MHRLAFSLVIPAFDEAVRLPAFLAAAGEHLSRRYPGAFEIVVVDDGSRDATAAIAARAPATRVLRLACNRGKGAAVRAGMLAARGDLRLFADADGATPITGEPRLAAALAADHDLAIGSRAAPGGVRVWLGPGDPPPTMPAATPNGAPVWHVRRHRHGMGRVFAALAWRVVGTPVADTQCGFKLFRADAARILFSRVRCDGWAFDVEVLALADRLGMRLAEVPVAWHETPGSKVRLGRDALQMAAALWPIRRRTAGVRAAAPVVLPVDEPRRLPVGRKVG